MQDKPDSAFDDPALKTALRRSLGAEQAPASLSQRIVQIASEQSRAPQSIPVFRRRAFRQAVAAVLAIGLGVAAILIWQGNRKDPYQAAYGIPNSLYRSMVNQHQERADQTAPDPVTSIPAAQELARKLGRPILLPDLTRDGWTFEGGAIRDWPATQVAQFFFTRGGAKISVLSMPVTLAPGARETYTYETTFSGTPIAGVVNNGGLHCLICTDKSGQVDAKELAALLRRHMEDVVRG